MATSSGNPALGARLRSLRSERHLKLGALAQMSDVSLAYISEVERGRKLPSLEVLDRLAGGLGMSVLELLDGVEPYIRVNPRARVAGRKATKGDSNER